MGTICSTVLNTSTNGGCNLTPVEIRIEAMYYGKLSCIMINGIGNLSVIINSTKALYYLFWCVAAPGNVPGEITDVHHS